MSASGAREMVPLALPPRAAVAMPGSKSLTNRSLIIAALADGDSNLSGVLDSDDTRVLVDALGRLGFAVEWERENATIRIAGRGGEIPARGADLFGGNAGTAVRFLVSLVALGHGSFRVDGDARMRERPIQDLLEGLAALGVRAHSEAGNGCPPVRVDADGLRGGRVRIPGETSSQFASSILLSAPYADGDLTIEITGERVGAPFVDMTVGLMRRAGVRVDTTGPLFSVACRQRYANGRFAIEPDATAASYFLAAAALCGGEVTVLGLGRDSLQGDLGFADVLAEMGAEVDFTPRGVRVRGTGELRGIDRDFRDISDTFLTAAALAPFASSPTTIRGIAHTRRQESDRVAAMSRELGKLGVRVREAEDRLEIFPSTPRGGDVETYGDHRIAMSFALVGLRVAGVRILDPGCVAKTFPDFFERLDGLRVPG